MREKLPRRLFGQEFNSEKLELIKTVIEKTNPCIREKIARNVCKEFQWFDSLGKEKIMSCKVSLLRLYRMGLIELPPPHRKNGNGKNYKVEALSLNEKPLDLPVGKLENLHLEIVKEKQQSKLWNSLIDHYHYLGYIPLVGHQNRYLIYCKEGLLGAIGFSSSAWKIKDRDDWIGWDSNTRESNLYLIINNSRFLILPWIHSKNLASKILSLCVRQIPKDYYVRYGYRPVLLETFVESGRFSGTCYKAANWIHLGKTKGRGKLDRYNLKKLPVKDIYVYPLIKNYRRALGVA